MMPKLDLIYDAPAIALARRAGGGAGTCPPGRPAGRPRALTTPREPESMTKGGGAACEALGIAPTPPLTSSGRGNKKGMKCNQQKIRTPLPLPPVSHSPSSGVASSNQAAAAAASASGDQADGAGSVTHPDAAGSDAAQPLAPLSGAMLS